MIRTGGDGRAGLFGAGNVFQVAGLRAGAFDALARVAALAQRTSLIVQLEFERAQHAAQHSGARLRIWVHTTTKTSSRTNSSRQKQAQ